MDESAATTLSRRVDLAIIPNSVHECSSNMWSKWTGRAGAPGKAAMMPGLKTKVPKSKGRSGSACL